MQSRWKGERGTRVDGCLSSFWARDTHEFWAEGPDHAYVAEAQQNSNTQNQELLKKKTPKKHTSPNPLNCWTVSRFGQEMGRGRDQKAPAGVSYSAIKDMALLCSCGLWALAFYKTQNRHLFWSHGGFFLSDNSCSSLEFFFKIILQLSFVWVGKEKIPQNQNTALPLERHLVYAFKSW